MSYQLFPLGIRGTAVAQWLRCYATNWKIAGSIPDGVTRIFRWHNPSDHTMALGSTQPLKQKWVPEEFSGGKCGRCVRLTTLPLSCVVVMKSGNLNFLEPSGPLQACNGTAKIMSSSNLPHRPEGTSVVWCYTMSLVKNYRHVREAQCLHLQCSPKLFNTWLNVTSQKCQECVELYLYSPICLHGM